MREEVILFSGTTSTDKNNELLEEITNFRQVYVAVAGVGVIGEWIAEDSSMLYIDRSIIESNAIFYSLPANATNISKAFILVNKNSFWIANSDNGNLLENEIVKIIGIGRIR